LQVHGRIIIDAVAYQDLVPSNAVVPKVQSSFCDDGSATDSDDDLDDVLLSPFRSRSRLSPSSRSRAPSENEAALLRTAGSYSACLSDESIMMFSGALYGYSLGDSEWGGCYFTF
jgi:hypothetical protein